MLLSVVKQHEPEMVWQLWLVGIVRQTLLRTLQAEVHQERKSAAAKTPDHQPAEYFLELFPDGRPAPRLDHVWYAEEGPSDNAESSF